MEEEEAQPLQLYGTLPNESNNAESKQKVSNLSQPLKKSGIIGTSTNLVNTIIGTGIFGMPYAFRTCGIIVGPVLLLAVAYLTIKSLDMLIGLANFHPRLQHLDVRTYEDLMSIPFGKYGRAFILFSMGLDMYSCCVAYLIVIKDTLPLVLGVDESVEGARWVMLVGSLIPLILSLPRDMASLSFTSLVNVFIDVIIVMIIAISSPIQAHVEESGGLYQVTADNWIGRQVFVGIGTLSFAFTCQDSSFIMSESLSGHTMQHWGCVTRLSIMTAGFLCLAVGNVGYLGYLGQTEGNILNNLDHDSKSASLARILLAFHMFLVYPVDAYVVRHVVVQIFFAGDMDGAWGFRPQLLAVVVYILVLIPAWWLDDLGMIMSLVGTFAASTVMFVAPGLLYLGLHGSDFLLWVKEAIGVGSLGWWVGGFPLWSMLAKTGCNGTDKFFLIFQLDKDNEGERSGQDQGNDIMKPCVEGFVLSIFFIVFGMLTLILAVWSNFVPVE